MNEPNWDYGTVSPPDPPDCRCGESTCEECRYRLASELVDSIRDRMKRLGLMDSEIETVLEYYLEAHS